MILKKAVSKGWCKESRQSVLPIFNPNKISHETSCQSKNVKMRRLICTFIPLCMWSTDNTGCSHLQHNYCIKVIPINGSNQLFICCISIIEPRHKLTFFYTYARKPSQRSICTSVQMYQLLCSSLSRQCNITFLYPKFQASTLSLFEPRREKTGFLHMRKQRRRSASL